MAEQGPKNEDSEEVEYVPVEFIPADKPKPGPINAIAFYLEIALVIILAIGFILEEIHDWLWPLIWPFFR